MKFPATRLPDILYILLLAITLLLPVKPPVALFAGIALALTLGERFPALNKKGSKILLQASVVGLGFGMNLQESLASGKDGMLFTIASVSGTLLIGWLLGKRLKVDTKTAYLISAGTAICGGSAIAATGPVLKAESEKMSMALATVFILNAVALFLFPVLGHWLNLSQHQFGLWSAIAIHDTSSVVGAASTYGQEALRVATTVKLTRALWIIPMTFFTAFLFKSKGGIRSFPWFILMFVLAMLINTYLNLPESASRVITLCSGKGLTVSLFFIGSSLSRKMLANVGFRPLLQGILLWLLVSLVSLIYILN